MNEEKSIRLHFFILDIQNSTIVFGLKKYQYSKYNNFSFFQKMSSIINTNSSGYLIRLQFYIKTSKIKK